MTFFDMRNRKMAQMWLFTYSSHVYLFKWNPIAIFALHRTCLSSIIRWFLLNVTFGIFICDIFRYVQMEIEKQAQMWLFMYSSHVYLFKWNPIAIFALHRTCLSSIIRWFLLNVTFGIFICDIFRYVKSKNGSNVVIYVFIPCLSVQMESYCHLSIT